jgi:LPXTG-motif cell wall-anchored protein
VVQTTAHVTNAKITGYDYYLDGSSSKYAHDQTSDTPHDKKFTGLATGAHTIQVYVDITGLNNQATHSDACVAQIPVNENPRVNQSKTVTDITKGSVDADGTQVNEGDILEFTLTTENVTGSDFTNYVGKDDFSDVLRYADFVDTSQLTNQGITLDSQNNLNWTVANIKAHASDVKTIKVQVKQSIPLTNNPSAMSPDYNCSITNSYGNQVSMTVDCSQVKALAETAESLPNTGSGTSVIIGGIVAAIAGYLFMRSRITAEELELVRQDYISTGGL